MNVFEYLDQSNAHYSVSEHTPTYSAQVMSDYLALAQPEIVDFAYRPERRG